MKTFRFLHSVWDITTSDRGSWDLDWGTSELTGDVTSIAVSEEGTVFVGGMFANDGNVRLNHVAEWDGSKWVELDGGVNGVVWSLSASPTGSLFVGGEFSRAGNLDSPYVAEWRDGQWSPVGSEFFAQDDATGRVTALAIDPTGYVYAAGRLPLATGIQTSLAKWDGLEWRDLVTAIPDSFSTIVVHDLAYHDDQLIAAGIFEAPSGQTHALMFWNGFKWEPHAEGINAVAIDVDEGSAYLAGTNHLEEETHAIRYMIRERTAMPLGAAIPMGDCAFDPMAIATFNGTVYIGGGSICGSGTPDYSYAVAEWNGDNWCPLDLGVDGIVRAIYPHGRDILIGGGFRRVNDRSQPSIAKWVSVLDTGANFDNGVHIKNVSIYPNPASDYTDVEVFIPRDGHVLISLYDIIGRQVHRVYEHSPSGLLRHMIKTKHLSNGIYMLEIEYVPYDRAPTERILELVVVAR